jgi:RND family efflux transporter MFP subunit
MKKKNKLIIIIIVVGTIITILLYNKSRMAIEARTDNLTSVPVSVQKVEKQKASDTYSYVGTITANNDVAIISETQGKVTAVMAEIGQYKEAGAVIIQVDDELKKANFTTAEINYEKSKKDLERFESLYKQNSATDQQLESARLAAKAAEAQYIVARRLYNDTKITAPISGIITSRPADLGTYIQSGMPVANIVDISKLKVKLNAAEQDAFRLRTGDPTEVTTSIYPGVNFKGKISSISSKADDAHTYPVEILLENKKAHPLKAGMFCKVLFSKILDDEVLTIPRDALVGSIKNPQVYVVEKDTAKLRNLIVGSEFGKRLIILDGLKENEIVVISGQNNLKDNSAVSVVK